MLGPSEPSRSVPGVLDVGNRSALRDLVDRYALAADARDGDAVADLFTDDGELHVHLDGDPHRPAAEIRRGRAALAAGPKRLDRYLGTVHLVGQQVLDVVDDRVSGVVYCTANHRYHGNDGQMVFVVHVRYLDDYALVEDRWRFAARRVLFESVEHRPVGGAIL